MTLKEKIPFAIRLLRNIPQDGPIELSYSGGKDSDIILELAREAGIPFDAVYKQTTIDPPGTIAHAKAAGARIARPKENFLTLVEKHGAPSRFRRFCCGHLKEYKIHDRAIQGIRRYESVKRVKMYKEPEMCRVYGKNEKARLYFPILEWTDVDVARFVADRGIKCHPLYYDEDGVFHAERRLGCIGCPMAHDNGLASWMKYPKLFKQYVKSYQTYLDNHQGTDWYNRMEGSAVNALFNLLFCDSREKYDRLKADPDLDALAFMEDFFGIEFEG